MQNKYKSKFPRFWPYRPVYVFCHEGKSLKKISSLHLWSRIQSESWRDISHEPVLTSHLESSILNCPSFGYGLAFSLTNKLASYNIHSSALLKLFVEAFEENPTDTLQACVCDIQALIDRDPACSGYTQCLLYFKGFQAIQCHRVANWLWKSGRKAHAYTIQSRVAEVFHVDIHPGATIGQGLLIDHATGVTIGETAVIGDNCSIFHHVTIGSDGTDKKKSQPVVGNGVLIGAGSCVLGPIKIGDGATIGAGSVVIQEVLENSVAVGTPARMLRLTRKRQSEHPEYRVLLDLDFYI